VKYFALLMLTAFSLLPLAGQEAKKVQEPEYIGIVFSLDTTGALLPLERQQPIVQTKVKAFGYGGAKSSTVFKGAKSPVRFKAGQDIQFVVRLSAGGMEPNSFVKLYSLAVSKDQREFVMAKAGSMGFNAQSSGGESQLSLNFAKYGEQSYKISPATPLPPGEYEFVSPSGQDRFLFGIDPQ